MASITSMAYRVGAPSVAVTASGGVGAAGCVAAVTRTLKTIVELNAKAMRIFATAVLSQALKDWQQPKQWPNVFGLPVKSLGPLLGSLSA